MLRNEMRGRTSSLGGRESGSTTFEAMVAVLILSIVGAAALGAASGGIHAYTASRKAILTAMRALSTDDTLRGAARKIRVPWWEHGIRLEIGEESARMPYWRGHAKEYLSVTRSDQGMTLTTPEGARVLPGVRFVSAAPLPYMDAPLRGLRVEYEIDGHPFTTDAEFGAWALGEASP